MSRIIIELTTWMKKCVVFVQIWIKRVNMEENIVEFFWGKECVGVFQQPFRVYARTTTSLAQYWPSSRQKVIGQTNGPVRGNPFTNRSLWLSLEVRFPIFCFILKDFKARGWCICNASRFGVLTLVVTTFSYLTSAIS